MHISHGGVPVPGTPQKPVLASNGKSVDVRHPSSIPSRNTPPVPVLPWYRGANQRQGDAVNYVVRVHCCGPSWVVFVPAFGCSCLVEDKRGIEAAARELIQRQSTHVPGFGIDLALGRVIECLGDAKTVV